jgi:hypothetical protein
VPFLGSIVEMVQDPHAFWERQRAYALPGLSWNSIVTKFTVMVTDPAVIRHVFNHNRCAGGVVLVAGWGVVLVAGWGVGLGQSVLLALVSPSPSVLTPQLNPAPMSSCSLPS